MDTTVALIFSLGLALSGQDSAAVGIETSTDKVQNTVLSQRQHKVRKRIQLTNAWLKQRKKIRRARVQAKYNNIQLASRLSCTADWHVV